MKLPQHLLHRRQTLAILGGAGVAACLGGRMTGNLPAVEADTTCRTLNPAMEEGPFFVDEKLLRSDIRTDPATGAAQAGVLLTLAVTIQNQSGACGPLAGAYVDIWQANAGGVYSDEAQENSTGQKFLRGYQITDDNGQVQFTTIYPGWYSGRTVHIHFRIRTYSGTSVLDSFETQAFFDEAVTDAVYTQAPYSARPSRDTRNATDRVYNGSSSASLNLWTLNKTASAYAATLTLAVTMKTAASAAPAIAAGGIANAASGAAGIAPGAWISIYGTNLAAAAHALTSSEIANNSLPTTLSGVSVQIDGVPAYMAYVSPSQINVLAPADANTGAVAVTVTNSAGASAPVTAPLQTVLPGLFTQSNYVRAVRKPDNAIVNGTGSAEAGFTTVAAAKAGDVLELYGTGFGPTSPSVAPGVVFSGAYPTINIVTVTIGGSIAPVSFAGLSGTGLCQINITVPGGLSAGDHAIVATTAGLSTPSSALLKITA